MKLDISPHPLGNRVKFGKPNTTPDFAGLCRTPKILNFYWSHLLILVSRCPNWPQIFLKNNFHHFRLNYFLPDLAGLCRTLENVTPRRTIMFNTTPDIPKFLGLCVDINKLIFLSLYIPLTPPLTVLNTLIVKKTTALASSLFTESLTNPLFSPSFVLCGSGY